MEKDNRTYYQKLLDPKWQIKRLEILQRDGGRCLICKSNTDTLEVHHEKYVNDPWDVDNKYLKTLCWRCHDVVEMCKTNKVKYMHFNRIPISKEKFIYLVNSKFDAIGNPGKFVFVIHNLSGRWEPINFYFSEQMLRFMLKTF